MFKLSVHCFAHKVGCDYVEVVVDVALLCVMFVVVGTMTRCHSGCLVHAWTSGHADGKPMVPWKV